MGRGCKFRPRLRIAAAVGLIAWGAAAAPAAAEEPGRPAAGKATAAEMQHPRFLSLRAARANVRVGPGRRYPIAWVFVRRGLPVRIVGRFETWRRIRDWEGSEGWIHQSLLSARRSVIVLDGPAPLRRKPGPDAELVAQVERRAIGRLLRCSGEWCRVGFTGRHGWIRKTAVWGIGAAGD